jgi:hypothetical protein
MRAIVGLVAGLCGRSRGVFRVAAAFVCAVAVLLGAAVVPAAGTVIHKLEGSFAGGEVPGGKSWYFAPGIAVDNSGGPSAGDVYVGAISSLSGGNQVYKFDKEGKYTGVQLNGSETPQGFFGFVSLETLAVSRGLAVDGSGGANRGDVYVVDAAHDVVDRFSEAGKFLCQITASKPVAPAEVGNECAGGAGSETPQRGFSASELKGFGVAVSPLDGDLYVADPSQDVIDEFNEKGEYVGQISGPHLEAPSSLAFSSGGELYVVNEGAEGEWYEGSNVVKFDAGGSFVSVLVSGGKPEYVAVNPSSDRVYVGLAGEKQIAEYGPGGDLFSTFGSEQEMGEASIAVSGSTGGEYATSFSGGGDAVYEYGPPSVIPSVSTQAATGVDESSATLNGHLEPDSAHGGGAVTACQFEYGPTTAYGFTVPCTPGPSYAGPEDVSAKITGLQHSSAYHFRLEAANAGGIASTGEDETVRTPGAPTVDRVYEEATQNYVVFRAHIDSWGYETNCQLQIVSEAAFQRSEWADAATVHCKPEDVGSAFADVPVRVRVNGLTQASKYDYRFIASNSAGSTYTPTGSFETFNIEEFKVEDRNQAGEPETQAGAHPYELVTTVKFNKTPVEENSPGTIPNTKDVSVELPAGLIGNSPALPRCSHLVVAQERCPGETQVGSIALSGSKGWSWDLPLYNVVPAEHVPAEFGAYIAGQVGAWMSFHVRTGSDYGVNSGSINMPAGFELEEVVVKVWGVPASPTHDTERVCAGDLGCPDPEPARPFLANPTSCAGPQTARLEADTWQMPGSFVTAIAELPGFTGCNQLGFEPTVEALPTTDVADSPSGLDVDVRIPQDVKSEGIEDPNGRASADLRDTKVALPPGLVVNPALASGLAACSAPQMELHGPEPAQCPDAAKIGRVEVDTPFVGYTLLGSVYVAAPYENPFDSLLAIYVVVDDPATGLVIKLAGDIEANPETGQLTVTIDEIPQLPFADIKLDLFAGPRAALRTSPTCGTFESTSELTPWSAPESGPPATWSSPFQITSAPGGGSCPAAAAEQPDSPNFQAGTETPVAGSYSPLVLRLHREDDSQELRGINTVLPPGLTAKLAGVAECPTASIETAERRGGVEERESPSCPTSSEVGTVTIGAGAGPAPFVTVGRVYLAGPYKGAPFSLAVVTPVVAGPYDLGTVVVRAALDVNPITSQVTVKSDPIPTILRGIPLDVKTILVKLQRPDFALNPTNCEKMSVDGEALSPVGQNVVLADPFQVSSCEALGFKPRFSASTSGKTSRADGASLHVVVTYPNARQGSEANIKSVHVELPKALPSRLSTLNHACVGSVFAQNPANCPPLSRIGYARAITPILGVPLAGPAYFVSHGSQKLPELILVLEGDGITIQLHGETFISPADITSTTFPAVPDQPITSLELTLPQGPDSALSANGNLCAATKTIPAKHKTTIRVKGHKQTIARNVKKTVATGLAMPTVFTAQNGAVLEQNTIISVSGCPKAKKVTSRSKSSSGSSSRSRASLRASSRASSKASGRRK